LIVADLFRAEPAALPYKRKTVMRHEKQKRQCGKAAAHGEYSYFKKFKVQQKKVHGLFSFGRKSRKPASPAPTITYTGDTLNTADRTKAMTLIIIAR